MNEIDEKVDRLARLAAARGLGGILLNTQPNFSWLTGGRSNQIDGSRESGGGSLLVSARGERFVVANNIEMPRLLEEALTGLDFAPCEYVWTEEQANPGTAIARARQTVCGTIGCDNGLVGGVSLDAEITAARAPLTPAEVERYRRFGRELGAAVGSSCRALVPDLSEIEVAQRVGSAVAGIGARAIVTLVAADDRMGRFRHPVPTVTRWGRQVLVGVCAQRHGLVCALSRIVVSGRVPDALETRTAATARVFASLLASTRAGATGADLFQAAARSYAEAGFPLEETRHHQGGATGYRSRDWIAHPASRDTVQQRQAFAWNPSITGTKIEETTLVTEQGLEVITTSPEWPTIPLPVRGQTLSAPAPLAL
jgi:Xaa-Pro aminopeptidase